MVTTGSRFLLLIQFRAFPCERRETSGLARDVPQRVGYRTNRFADALQG